MKSIACVLAVPLLCLSVPTTVYAQQVADEAVEQRHQLAREIVERGFPQESRMELFGGVMQQLISQLNVAQPQLAEDAEIQSLVQRFQQRAIDIGMDTLASHMGPIMDGLALAYADIYSLDELQAFHAFVSSPQGYGFLAKSSATTAHPAFAAANQSYINEYMAKVPQLQGELREELMELLSRRESKPGNS